MKKLKKIVYNLKLGQREYRLAQHDGSIDLYVLEARPHDYSWRGIGYISRELSSDTDRVSYYDYVDYIFYEDPEDVNAAYDVEALKNAVAFLEKHPNPKVLTDQ